MKKEKKVEFVSTYYNKSDSVPVQGGRKNVKKKKKEGYWTVAGADSGTEVMVKSSECEATFNVDGVNITRDAKNMVRKYNKTERATEKGLDNLEDAFRKGKIVPKYLDNDTFDFEFKKNMPAEE